MIIKVCGITKMDQFNWLDRHGITMIGLNFYTQSKRFISQPLTGIKSASKAKKVGVFVNPELPFLLDKVDEYNLDLVQLHGDESKEFCQVVAKHITIIKAFGVDENFSFADTESYLNSASYFLFDTKSPAYGGSGKKFNWHKLSQYQLDKPFLLSGGIQLEDIPAIIDLNFSALAGIDVNSGFEISPGIKDLDKIDIMMKLINDDESR
jgi:phosphoribosylanthranilate isomerase